MADFKVDVPAPRFAVSPGPRTGPQDRSGGHGRGRQPANGSADGLVAIEIDPPCHTERSLSTFLPPGEVSNLIISLVGPDGFIAAVQGDHVYPQIGSRKE